MPGTPLHRGRNQIYSFHCLLGRPQRPQGCQKMRHYPLNLDLEVWCSNIEPKLNEHQKTMSQREKSNIFLSLLTWTPPRPQGCQKMCHYPLNLNLEVWCSTVEPKLNEHQNTSRSHQKRLIFC